MKPDQDQELCEQCGTDPAVIIVTVHAVDGYTFAPRVRTYCGGCARADSYLTLQVFGALFPGSDESEAG